VALRLALSITVRDAYRGSREEMGVQLSVASEGGSGTPTPDLPVEVDDLKAAPSKQPVDVR
jgi:hypothetical protein